MQNMDGLHHVCIIGKGFAHAHEDDVGDYGRPEAPFPPVKRARR